MLLNYMACAFIVISLAITLYFYSDSQNQYSANKDKKIPSTRSFAYVYHYLRVSTLFFGLSALLTNWSFLLVIPRKPYIIILGLLFILLGNSLFIIAKKTLGTEYSPCFDAYIPKKVVSNGIYQYIRHPIYSANLILLLGIFLASGSLWLLLNLIIMSIYYYHSIKNEESALEAEFPDYQSYKAQAGMLFPRLFN